MTILIIYTLIISFLFLLFIGRYIRNNKATVKVATIRPQSKIKRYVSSTDYTFDITIKK
jgi:hypothetical protein